MYKVSVIIPIYNVAPYIKDCARSLLGQTLSDIEYIFVDDCSTDDSVSLLSEIIKEYPSRKDDVRIIKNNKNIGASLSRKIGLTTATGEYIIFCDGDDVVDINAYEKLYSKCIEGADIAVCEMAYFEDNNLDNKVYDSPTYLGLDNRFDILRQIIRFNRNGAGSSLCDKLIKKSILDNNIIWPKYSLYEDRAICVQLLLSIQSVGYVQEPLYYYRQHSDSVMRFNQSYEKIIDKRNEAYENISVIEKVLKERNLFSKFRKDFIRSKMAVKLMGTSELAKSLDGVIKWDNTYPNLWFDVLFKSDYPLPLKLSFTLRSIYYKFILMFKLKVLLKS